MPLQPFKLPTLKEFRDNPKNKSATWNDVYGGASCDVCGIPFQPGETIYPLWGRKAYHKKCIPKEDVR